MRASKPEELEGEAVRPVTLSQARKYRITCKSVPKKHGGGSRGTYPEGKCMLTTGEGSLQGDLQITKITAVGATSSNPDLWFEQPRELVGKLCVV